MARASEQFGQADITRWGLVALLCGGLAVFGGNVAVLIPSPVLAQLHKPRFDGANLTVLGQQMAALRDETDRLRRDNEVLADRVALQQQTGIDAMRRVGTLEASLPNLAESQTLSTGVDHNTVTAAIGMSNGIAQPAEGGSVVVRQIPLQQGIATGDTSQPLPAPITGAATIAITTEPFGVMLGRPVAPGQLDVQWHDLQVRLGSLLLGLEPRSAETGNGQTVRLLAGPLDELADATQLCERLEQVSIACQPMPFTGTPLAQ